MDKQEGQFPIEEQIIEGEYSNDSPLRQEEIDQESDSLVDQLLPQPAFYIQQDNEHLTQQERDAFSYIMAVRSQKQNIKRRQQNKVNLNIHPLSLFSEIKQIDLTQKNQQQSDISQIETLIQGWRSQTVQNWKLVIANLKYLQKNPSPQYVSKQKLSNDHLRIIPNAYKLCFNKSLNLTQIERYLVQYSNFYYYKIENEWKQTEIQELNCNYHLWIYSLLALHQSYASYNNFEALASVNATMERQYKYYEQRITKEKPITQIFKKEIIGWLINLMLLIDVFRQFYLKKYLKIVKLYKLL